MSTHTDWLPRPQAELLEWVLNFEDKVSTRYSDYGLTEDQAIAYSAVADDFVTKYHLAMQPETGTHPNIVAKNDAMRLVRSESRALVRIIQAFPGTTNTMRAGLGITIPDEEPSSIPVPTQAPLLVVGERFSRTVKIRLWDSVQTENRGRPAGVDGATLFSWVGENPPANIADWTFEGSYTRTTMSITFPFEVPLASKVWFRAFWFNPKAQAGPPCNPVSTYLDSGMEEAA